MPPMPPTPPAPPSADPMGGGVGDPMGDEMDDPMSMGGENGKNTDTEEYKKQVGNISHLLQNGDIDAEDVKWGAGMLFPQIKKNLEGSELKKLADKLTDVSDISDKKDGAGEPIDDDDMGDEPTPPNQMESRKYLKQRVTEIMGSLLDDSDAQKNREQKKITNRVKGSPFKTRFK